MVDQPVDILEIIAKLSPPVVEQVIDVPKIIQDSAPQRLKPPEPQQLVEQLVEVPLPASGFVGGTCLRCQWPGLVTHLGSHGTNLLVVPGHRPHPVETPVGDHRQPRAVYKYWARVTVLSLLCGTCSFHRCSDEICADNFYFPWFKLKGKGLCEQWEVFLYGDKTIKVDRVIW